MDGPDAVPGVREDFCKKCLTVWWSCGIVFLSRVRPRQEKDKDMSNRIIKALGTDDSVNVCDCCGRNNLKATVAFETEDGDVVNYGVVCAARALGTDAKTVRADARKADEAKSEAARKEIAKAHSDRNERWIAHLVRVTGGITDYSGRFDVFRMIQAAGGFSAASVGFEA